MQVLSCHNDTQASHLLPWFAAHYTFRCSHSGFLGSRSLPQLQQAVSCSLRAEKSTVATFHQVRRPMITDGEAQTSHKCGGGWGKTLLKVWWRLARSPQSTPNALFRQRKGKLPRPLISGNWPGEWCDASSRINLCSVETVITGRQIQLFWQWLSMAHPRLKSGKTSPMLGGHSAWDDQGVEGPSSEMCKWS